MWDHSTFSKNRDRLLESDIARGLFDAILAQAEARDSSESMVDHLEPASLEECACGSDDPPEGGGRNPERDPRAKAQNDTQ